MPDFNDNRENIFSYIENNYSDVYSDFNDFSVGTMFVDLLAHLITKSENNLNGFLQETNIEDARLYRSLMSIAKKNNIKIQGKSPSSTLLELKIRLPVSGTGPNLDYAPLIIRGSRFTGGGQSFELINDVDFNSPFSKSGTPNRTITPIYNNNALAYYEIVKSEIVNNGLSKFFKREINIDQIKPYQTIVLPDPNVLEVTDIILVEGQNLPNTPNINQLYDSNLRWDQVDNLSQQYVFKFSGQVTEGDNVRDIGEWVKTNKRFVVEYTDKFFTKITFGGGKTYDSNLPTGQSRYESIFNEMLTTVNKQSMGQLLTPNSTLYVKYRIGGGKNSNVGSNSITSPSNINMIFRTNNSISQNVRQSLSVTNPIPAIGGNDEPTIEDLRNIIKKSGVNLNTVVTESDLENIVRLMPSRFGRPFKTNASVINNRFVLNILNLDENGSLSNSISSALKTNIHNFLKNKKSPNTLVEILPAKVINYGLDLNILLDRSIDRIEVDNQIKSNLLNILNTKKNNIGKDLNVTEIIVSIGSISGVISVNNLIIKNMQGENYSNNTPFAGLGNENQIFINENNLVISNYDEFYELKDINTDLNITYNVL